MLSLSGSVSAVIPAGWADQDIGSSTGGSANEAGGTWTVTGNGNDIWGTADAFHYVYVPLDGDGQMVARVVDNGTGSNNWTKGGVMIRQDTTPGSPFSFMCITGSSGGGAAFQWRDTQGAGAAWPGDHVSNISPPHWVKLVREGNSFTGYLSTDGVTWEASPPDPHTVNMTGTVLIGLAVTSHAAGEVRTFTFDNVSTELPKVALRPTPADGALHMDTWVNLSWNAGSTAVSHDVYFGESFDDVNDGTGDTFRGNQTTDFYIVGFPGFPFPDGLVPGTTYYWRIDEVEADGTKHKGNVWSFMIPPKSAYSASPSDGARYVDLEPTLTWDPGFGAKLHTVFFGDSFDEVSAAAAGAPSATTKFSPGALEEGKTYYWRVDEFNPPTTVKGDVWSFTTIPNIPIGDPTLVAWYKFEAGEGTKVIDFSGHGNHGDIVDNVLWVPGLFNLGLEFLGDNEGHVEMPPRIVTSGAGSVTMWVSTNLTDDEGMFWYGTETGGDGYGGENEIHVNIDDPGQVDFFIEGSTDVTINGPSIVGAGWTHVAATWDLTGGCKLYINGVEEGSVAHNGTDVALATIRLGRPVATGNGNRYYEGLMDDVRLFNVAITAEQVNEIMTKGEDPLLAGSPNPRNNAVPSVDGVTPLNWSPGENAAQHDVYFGTDRDAVANADVSDTTGVYRGQQSTTSFTPAEPLEWGTGPYYWRIDEISTDGTVSEGNVWSFTVADYLIVDDSESYNDIDPPDAASNRIFDKWIDGFGTTTNGALVGNDLPPYAERSVVHGGGQAMPYSYDTNLKIAEATLTLVSPRDWTSQGVTKLSLWFRGDAANAAERIFVALNGTAVVYHGDPAATQIAGWTEWVIDLQAFAGVNLTNVSTVTMGFGTKGSPAAGGTGQMYFDDIRLVR